MINVINKLKQSDLPSLEEGGESAVVWSNACPMNIGYRQS